VATEQQSTLRLEIGHVLFIDIVGFLEAPHQPAERVATHSGPVNAVSDVNDFSNVTGAGISMVQRVLPTGRGCASLGIVSQPLVPSFKTMPFVTPDVACFSAHEGTE
jgi:hypothetical protein